MQLLKAQIKKLENSKNVLPYPISLNYLYGLIYQKHKYQIKKCNYLSMRGLRKKGAWGGRAAWEGSYIFF